MRRKDGECQGPSWPSPGATSGAILETWVIGEILKSWWHAGRRAPFYFCRDKDQKEIDLLILQDTAIYSLEIKKTASPRKDCEVLQLVCADYLGVRYMAQPAEPVPEDDPQPFARSFSRW